MKKNHELRRLLQKINRVPDERELLNLFLELSPEKLEKPSIVTFINAHALNLCFADKYFLNCLLKSEYLFRDGSGMNILFKMLGMNPGLNLNGTDLIPRIINYYAGQDAALLGTRSPYLENAAAAIQRQGVSPALVLDGFQNDYAYLTAAQKHPSALIILAMGMPKQERVAALLAENLDYPCLIICGGAILDFIGGKVRRAPLIFRRFGMEWLYRLMQEPRRLFQRYMVGNFVFICRSLSLALALKCTDTKSFIEK